MSHDNHVLKISVSKKSLGRVTNQNPTWAALIGKLSTPAKDTAHTLDQYLALSRDDQGKLKNRGFMVGGHCKDGVRKAQNIDERSCLCFDVDAPTPGQITVLEAALPPICDHEFFAHTTRKHSPDTPRWRVVVPLARLVPADQFGALSRIVAAGMFRTQPESMDAIDDVSFRIGQVMYWPSVCKDAEFVTIHNEGNLLDADAVLEAFGNWPDWKALPFSEARSRKRPSDPTKRATDPREKVGIIGAFCRAYSIEDAIAKFLPEVYAPGDDATGKPRYTFVGGTTANGAIVEDDGLFLYSHHGTDPVSERLINAFDLVRIHKFGDLDKDKAEDAKPTSLPSYQAMFDFVNNDPESLAEFNEAVAEAFDILGAEDEDEDEGGGVEGDKEKPKKKKKPTPLDRMNSRHAVVFMSGKTLALTFYEKQEVAFGTMNDLHILYANDPMPTRTRGGWNRCRRGGTGTPGGAPTWRASCSRRVAARILRTICGGASPSSPTRTPRANCS